MRHPRAPFVLLFTVLAVALLGAALPPRAAADGQTLTPAGFQAKGIAMEKWRWLANESGNGSIVWSFNDKQIASSDLVLRFEGLAAYPPNSKPEIKLRLHYGFPGGGNQGGVLAAASVILKPTGAATPVGTAVAGTLTITRADLDKLAPAARKLEVRLDQADNKGLGVAFTRQGLTIMATAAPGAATEDEDSSGGAGAAGYASNGNLIAGWHWLRDAKLQHYATWHFEDVTVPAGGLPLSFTLLATDRPNGGPGIAASFALRYGTDAGVLEGRGGRLVTVHLDNVAPSNDPLGYLNKGLVLLPTGHLGGEGRSVPLYLRIQRLAASGPHIAVRADSVTLGEAGGNGDDEPSGGGSGDGWLLD